MSDDDKNQKKTKHVTTEPNKNGNPSKDDVNTRGSLTSLSEKNDESKNPSSSASLQQALR